MSMLKKSALVLTLLAGFATHNAQALETTQTFSIASQTTDWVEMFNVNRFNTALGTLNAVTFSYSGTLNNTVSFENTGNGTGRFTAQFTNILGVVNNPDPEAFALSEAYDSQSYTTRLAKTDGVRTNVFSPMTLSGSFSASSTDLAAYSGSGTFSLGLRESSWVSMTTPGNSRTSATSIGSGSLSVTYAYTAAPVPEPESYAMFLAGLCIMGTISRRRLQGLGR